MDPHSDPQSQTNEAETQTDGTESKAMPLEERSLKERRSLQVEGEPGEGEPMPRPGLQKLSRDSTQAEDE